MSSQTMGAGSGPAALAKARHARSTLFKTLSGVFVAAPILALIVWHDFPILICVLFLITARFCFLYSRDYKNAAKRAEKGGEAERGVVDRLAHLPPGWKVEAGIYFEKFGDIDILVSTPKGKSFVIDVKSHKGEVHISPDGHGVNRIVSGSQLEFERDILQSVRKQAMRLKDERGLTQVIPVLAFTRAKLFCPGNKIDDVWLVEEADLQRILEDIEAHS